MKIGYARVSTRDQEGSLRAQETALAEAGCSKIFQDRLSGARADRPRHLGTIWPQSPR